MKRLFVFLVLSCSCCSSYGTNIAIARGHEVEITLTDEKCTLEAVTNLPFKAIWKESGKEIEGCWGALQGVILSYWADKTVTVAPTSAFKVFI